MDIIGFLSFIGLLDSNGLLGFYWSSGFSDLEKCPEGLVVMTSYGLGDMSGGFGETSYDQL